MYFAFKLQDAINQAMIRSHGFGTITLVAENFEKCISKMALLHLGPIIFGGNDKTYATMVCYQLPKTM